MLRVVASLLAVVWKRMQQLPRLRVVPHFSSGIVERGNTRPGDRKISPPRVSFSRVGDFHAHSRFARSTIPEERWGTTRSLTTPNNTQQHATGCANRRNM